MKNFFKKIIRTFQTIIVAIFLGLAKSFSHKVEYKEGQKEKRIEGEKWNMSFANDVL